MEKYLIGFIFILAFLTNPFYTLAIALIINVIYFIYNKNKKIENRKTLYFETNKSSQSNEGLLYKISESPNNFHKLFQLIGVEYKGHSENDMMFYTTKVEIKNNKIEIIEKTSWVEAIVLTIAMFALAIALINELLGNFDHYTISSYSNLPPSLEKIILVPFLFVLIFMIIPIFTKAIISRLAKNNTIARGVFDNVSQVYIDGRDNTEDIIPFDDILGYVVAYKVLRKSRRNYGFFTIDMVLKNGEIIALINSSNFSKPIDDDKKTIKEAMLFSEYTNKPVYYLDDY